VGHKIPATGDRLLYRRAFLSAGLGAGLGAATLRYGGEAKADGSPPAAGTRTPVLPARSFGKTGLRLPILAFGGSAMVTRWQATYGPQLSFERRVAMVRHAFDSGVRYFDTSPNYTESESIIGAALRDVRDQVYVATKVGVPPSDDTILVRGQVRESVEHSLERLQTDAVDCIQVHGPVFEYCGFQRARELYEELVKLREEKLCRWIGLTGHTAFETMFRLIDTGLYDQLLVAYGYFPKGMDTILSPASLAWRERCLDRARELGMGVVAMKVMGSFLFGYRASAVVPDFSAEKLARLRAAALRWALHDDRVTLAVVGVSRPEEIDQNIATLSGELALSDDDRRVLSEFSTRAFQGSIVREMKVV
jgi:aryl-alcohol dehydrogenase-like predicted oxidoreductase